MLTGAKIRAKKKGIAFSLSPDDVSIPEFCPVLGIRLLPTGGTVGLGREASPSLDRVDPDRGYVKGNVIVVSMRANRLRSDASVEELRALYSFYSEIVK